MVNRITDKNDPKYILALQFLNHILTNNNKSQIQDILDFKNITRQEILKQENLDKLNEMENELYKHFDKDELFGIQESEIEKILNSTFKMTYLLSNYRKYRIFYTYQDYLNIISIIEKKNTF